MCMIPFYKEIYEYFCSKFPEEACGVLLNKSGKLKWVPVENVAEDKENTFSLSPAHYANLCFQGTIYAIVHSHPDQSSEPSESDIKTSDFLGIDYIIVSVPSGEYTSYIPNREIKPLLNREYRFGEQDCWTLIVDYYKQELGIDIPKYTFEDDWWEKGIDYYTMFESSFGFEKVSSPEKNDIIIISMMSEIPNHFGIYLGDDTFMHHAVDRLSCRESIYGVWSRYITGFSRCKKFI